MGKSPRKPIDATVYIPEPVHPLARAERYEEPVFDALERAGLGERGDGGGSLCNDEGEVQEVDFDVVLTSVDGVALVTQTLEARGAPKGSTLRYVVDGKEVEVAFGTMEGVVIEVDPEADDDVQELVDRVLAVLGDAGEYRGSWRGTQRTALYFYGRDARAIAAQLEPIVGGTTARVTLRT